MIPQPAIEKSVEGGWNCGGLLDSIGLGKPQWEVKDDLLHIARLEAPLGAAEKYHYRTSLFKIALDPTFWQALGKALGWRQDGWMKAPFQKRPNVVVSQEEWQHNAFSFYDLILTGGDVEKFWNEILK